MMKDKIAEMYAQSLIDVLAPDVFADQVLRLISVTGSLLPDIRDEMDADMEDSGMAQGEIESCLTHWGNKYVIHRKEWFSNEHRV